MKRIIYNVGTGETTEVEVGDVVDDVTMPIEELRSQKLKILLVLYKDAIIQGFTSSATGTPIFYGYSQQDQLNYSKWANVFALNTTKESVIIGSVSDGVVTMTREQFLTFIRDAEAYEVGLYTKRKDLETQINNAVTIEELSSIVISL